MTKEESWLLKEKYFGEKTEGFFTDCARLTSGEPLAYIIGTIPFLDTTIHLDSRPLIPRVETEFWVAHAISEIQDTHGPHKKLSILDLCAGSGCIGVAVAKHILNANVDFVEIDTAHHKTIEKNIRTQHIDHERTQVIGGNLFEHVTKTYDYIFSNPPYINHILYRTEQSVTRYEPHQALFGGQDGMECIELIIQHAFLYISHNGVLYLEHEPEQVDSITKRAVQYNLYSETRNDQYNEPRYTRFTRINT